MATVRHLGLFPWCVNSETSFFKGEELKTVAVPMWWRVKRWDFSLSIPTLGSMDEILDVSNQTGTVAPPNYQTEADLVCGSFDHVFTLGQLIPFYSAPHINIGPRFELEIDTGGETNPLSSTFYVGFSEMGTVQIIIGGANINTTRAMYSNDVGGYSAFAVFQAVEYWPYDPGDGLGPIYDSATGAQLRPFPN